MSLSNLEAIMFADYSNVEGQLAMQRVVYAFVQKVLHRLRGEGAHAHSAA